MSLAPPAGRIVLLGDGNLDLERCRGADDPAVVVVVGRHRWIGYGVHNDRVRRIKLGDGRRQRTVVRRIANSSYLIAKLPSVSLLAAPCTERVAAWAAVSLYQLPSSTPAEPSGVVPRNSGERLAHQIAGVDPD